MNVASLRKTDLPVIAAFLRRTDIPVIAASLRKSDLPVIRSFVRTLFSFMTEKKNIFPRWLTNMFVSEFLVCTVNYTNMVHSLFLLFSLHIHDITGSRKELNSACLNFSLVADPFPSLRTAVEHSLK